MWLALLIIAIVIGAVIGFLNSDDGERGTGALSGAIIGGAGCAQILLRIFIFGLFIYAFIWLFGTLFG